MLSTANGQFTYSDGQFNGSVATLICDSGYVEMNSPATCSPDGWSSAPMCTCESMHAI